MNDNLLEAFGLTERQTVLLYSVQAAIAEHDYELDGDPNPEKLKWISKWKKVLKENWEKALKEIAKKALPEENGEKTLQTQFPPLIDKMVLYRELREEVDRHENKTWFYILVLECITFRPFTPLTEEDNKEKTYSKCKFNEKAGYDYLKSLLVNTDRIPADRIDRLKKVYEDNINRISGRIIKIFAQIASTIAVGAIAAALAATFAGPIAVAILGSQFAGLHGAALVSACLAMLGGGAIAVGGAGMAGGVAVIAGGGALLGLAAGGAANGAVSLLAASSPDFTLTQAAKLETILREIILNAQHDVKTAQKIIARLEDRIVEMQNKLTELELKDKENKKAIQNLKESINYMKNSHTEMRKFTSAYEIGLSAQN